jgi:RHS repeat-associated protein
VNTGARITEVRRIKGDRMLLTNVTAINGGQKNIYALHTPNAATGTLAGASASLIWSFNSTSPYVTTGLSSHLALQPLIIHNENPIYTRTVDLKRYELTDHLGNVRAVVSDRLLADYDVSTNANPSNLRAEVRSRSDYYPFGSLLPGRNFSSSSYDYGFNGKRKDDEIHGATGTSYDFGARLYDPRVSRWLKMDPQAGAYPGHSPYCFVLNTPIRAIDPDGEWVYFVISTGGNPQAFDVAQTRIKEIQGSKDFEPQRDHVYFLEVSDLGTLSDQIAKCVQDAHQNGYGLTVEASFFGHAAGDGPVGASVTSRNSLAGVTGNNNPINGDQKQLSPAGWMEVDFNFDPSGSVANFYGCNTAEFAERFITYQPDVSYASGIGGGAGPSYTFEGSFSHVLWNIFGSPEYYADKDENGNVGARFVYSRDTYRPSEGPSGYMDAGKNWIQYRLESFINGNVGINNSNGCPENQSGQ